MSDDLIPEDTMGIFTEAQRSYTDPIEEDVIDDATKTISEPYYTPGWEIFEQAAQEQIALWNSTQTLGDLTKMTDIELKSELRGRQLASNFVSGFVQSVLIAMKERERRVAK